MVVCEYEYKSRKHVTTYTHLGTTSHNFEMKQLIMHFRFVDTPPPRPK